MKKSIILILMLFMLVTSVSAQIAHNYKIDLTYQQGSISYKTISVEPSEEQLKTPEGLYIAEVVSFDNKILNLTYFDISTTLFVDYLNSETGELGSGDIIELNESEVVLYVPYYENAKEINIYDWNLNNKLSIEVSSYAKETAIAEEIEETEKVEAIAEEQVVPEETIDEHKTIKKVLLGLLIAAGIVIMLVFISILLFRKKRNNNLN